MSLLGTIASAIAAAGIVGGGLYKLGAGLVAMSEAVKTLISVTADHEKRMRVLEGRPPGAGA